MYLKANPDGYALALFELVQEQHIEQDAHQVMIALANSINCENNKLITFLADGYISKEEKFKVIDELLESFDNNKLFSTFLKVLVESKAIGLLERIINAYVKLSDKHLNVRFALVSSAFEMKEETLEAIKQKLEHDYQCRIVIEHVVDKTLISGLKIQMGSVVIERSFDLDLKQMQNILIKKGV